MGSPSRPTAAELAAMRSALRDLQGLQARMGGGGAISSDRLVAAMDISAGVGPLIDGAGLTIASYYGQRAQAVHESIERSKRGIAAIVELLSQTIDNYDHHEHRTAQAAAHTAGPSSSAAPAVGARGKG